MLSPSDDARARRLAWGSIESAARREDTLRERPDKAQRLDRAEAKRAMRRAKVAREAGLSVSDQTIAALTARGRV